MLGNMSATSKIPSMPNVAFLGLLIFLCLYSDIGVCIPEPLVGTDPHVVIEVGTSGILPCRIQRQGYSVEWKRQLLSETELLVSFDPFYNVGARDGPGYEAGLFNMTDDYSLVIKYAKVQDEGLYMCSFSDYQTGKTFRNSTKVSVQALPQEPFPTIQECIGKVDENSNSSVCTVTINSTSNLTCLVEGYYPDIDLFFLHGSHIVTSTAYEEWNNADGTKSKSTTIQINVSDEPYQCVASGLPGMVGNRSVSVIVLQVRPQDRAQGPHAAAIAVPVTVIVLGCLTVAVIVKYRRKRRGSRSTHGFKLVESAPVEDATDSKWPPDYELRVIASLLSPTAMEQLCSKLNIESPPQEANEEERFQALSQLNDSSKDLEEKNTKLFNALKEIDQEATTGPISKYELCLLVAEVAENHAFEKLREALRRLRSLPKNAKLEKEDDFFESLCQWKSETSANSTQRIKLFSACYGVGMSHIARKVIDFTMARSHGSSLSKYQMEHMLWQIGDTRKISEILATLELDHAAVDNAIASEKGRREVVYAARKELQKWLNGKFNINPVVVLSLKLDYLQWETDLFKIQLSQMEEIDIDEMRTLCRQICKQHLTHLMKAHRDMHGEDLANQIERIDEENNVSLLNTQLMLQDWVSNEECSNYEKRNKLKKAVEVALQRDHADAKWPPDDELRVIASFLSSASMEQLCSKLGIKSPPQEANGEEWFQALTRWNASTKDLEEKHTKLFNALKEINQEGLIPRAKGHLVYKAELVDIAFQLFTQDLLPFTEALGISAAKLVDYKRVFQPSHMTQGTVGLLCKLFESGERSHLLKVLKEMPYPNVSASGMLALEISFGEVCTVSANLANIQELKRMQASTSMPYGDDSFLTNVEKNIISPGATSTHGDDSCDEGIQPQYLSEIFNETTTVLKSAIQTGNKSGVSAESFAFLKHSKVWRERPRLSPFNFRLALAYRLRSENNCDQIYDFLRGHYNEGIVPLAFILNILQTTDPKQREILGNLMGDPLFQIDTLDVCFSADIPFKDNWFELTSEEVMGYVYTWTNTWILEMIAARLEKDVEEDIARKHKECNDKLVDNGFLDLAREIMISEQQPADTSRFTDV